MRGYLGDRMVFRGNRVGGVGFEGFWGDHMVFRGDRRGSVVSNNE